MSVGIGHIDEAARERGEKLKKAVNNASVKDLRQLSLQSSPCCCSFSLLARQKESL